MTITNWVEGCFVLRGDRAKVVKGKRVGALDQDHDGTAALVIQVCADPFEANRYLKHIESVWNKAAEPQNGANQ